MTRPQLPLTAQVAPQVPTRLGFLVPRRNAVLEPEIYRGLPTGVSAHFARLDGTGETRTSLGEMRNDVERAAASLDSLGLSALVLACTAASFYRGRRSAEAVGRKLQALNPAPAVTAGAAVVDALQSVGARRIALVTPYRGWLTKRLIAFLEEYRLVVVAAADMGLARHIDQVSGDALADLVRRTAAGTGADAVFISCTNLPALHLVAGMEKELGLPVVSSNQAVLWAGLRLAGLGTAGLSHQGSLFSQAGSLVSSHLQALR